ncbi:hypothetical protein [Lolliginicoccus suaedae]|uniref:hypothetical protein n=1 Tax=Lolliginicoccus suaedae TaxID=2605429 RepID=UPI0011EBB815|nr:hypothetical protein [Lolliginicoccus suaedae]
MTGHECDDEQALAVAFSIIERWPVGREVHADAVMLKMGAIRFCEPRRLGLAFRQLHAEGMLVALGARRTTKPHLHGSYQTVWRRVNTRGTFYEPTSRLQLCLDGMDGDQ